MGIKIIKTKICTDIDQSKKLTESGIDINTADIIYNILDESYIRHDTPIDKYHMPAWSLSALLGLIKWNYNLEKILFEKKVWDYHITENTTEYEIAKYFYELGLKVRGE